MVQVTLSVQRLFLLGLYGRAGKVNLSFKLCDLRDDHAPLLAMVSRTWLVEPCAEPSVRLSVNSLVIRDRLTQVVANSRAAPPVLN